MKSNQIIDIKSAEELQKMRKGGKILALILNHLIKEVKPEITGLEIEAKSNDLLIKYGVKPAFLNFHGYPYNSCISINEFVVHGFPNEKIFKSGDLVSIDFGIIYQGFYLDSARSIVVSSQAGLAQTLVELTKQSFYEGLKGIKAGSHVGDIGFNIEKFAKTHNLGIVRDLCGHGIGKNLQEFPPVFNFGKFGSGPLLVEGNVVAIEPMLTLGGEDIEVADDGWSVKTKDNSLSAHHENTVIITKNGTEVITESIS